MSREQQARAIQESRESIWYLKDISFEGNKRKIITQNYNGPCSFIAICNILILRGDIEILPADRKSASYEFLAQLIGDYLLRASPDVDISAALSMMPLTQKGMDLNPLFTSITAFRPSGDNGALKLFEQANIKLLHGWIVDPDGPEYAVLSKTEDYDTSVNLIVAADDVAKGQLVLSENSAVPGPRGETSENVVVDDSIHISDTWSEEDRKKVEDALIVRNFLDSTSSQMTYHGLFTLASTIKPGELVALFRNSHLSVLYKPRPLGSRPSGGEQGDIDATVLEPALTDEHAALYILVTDHSFYNEPSVVWERIEDVDGASSAFVDAEFMRSSPAGGDFAGHTPESVAAMQQREAAMFAQYDPEDRELARRLQAEEDAHAREMYRRGKELSAQRSRERSERRRIDNEVQGMYNTNPSQGSSQQPTPQGQSSKARAPKVKKKTSCIIM